MNLRKPYFLMHLAVALLLPVVLLLPAAAHAATIAYTGPSGGDWNTPGNWSGGAVPGPGDTAVVTGTTVVVGTTPPAPDAVQLSSATISVASGATLTVANSMTISIGTLTGPGAVALGSASTLSINTLTLNAGVDFTLGTSTTWSSGSIGVVGHASITSLVVPAGATFPLLDGGLIGTNTTGDGSRVVNNGTITKSGAGTTALNPRFVNTGTVSVAGGTLNATSGPPDGQSHTGAFSAAAGASLALLGGLHHLANGASFAGQGTITYTGGTFEAGAAIPVERMRFGGSIAFGAGSSLSVANSLAFAAGAAGQFNGPGTVGFGLGATLSTEASFGGIQLLGGVDFTLPPGNGTSWTAGSISVTANPAITSLVVPAGATFPLLDGGFIGSNTIGDTARIVNNGTVVKSGAGKTAVNPQFFNSGLVNVQAGTMGGSGGPGPFTQTSGEIVVASGAFLEMSATLNGGTLRGRGGVSHVTNNGGTVAPGAAGEKGVLSVAGNYTQGSSGTLEVDINGNTVGNGGASGYDRLAVGAVANLAGTLAIVNDPSFPPQQSDSFTILTRASGSGTFGTVTGAVTPQGTYEPTYTPTQVNLGLAADTTGPSVTIEQAAGQADPTSSSPILFDVLFSEPVSGFAGSDVSFAGSTAGGTLAASVSGSGASYQVSVSGMTSSGDVVASILAGAATDGAGNQSSASTSTDNTVAWVAPDTTGPSVTINQAGGQQDPTADSPIRFDVLFSEPVTGFAGSDVSFIGSTVGGTLSASVSGSGASYEVSVSGMSSDGTVVASIPAGGASDAGGNTNTASTSTDNSVRFIDATFVTINQAAGQADPTSSSPILFDVVFSKSVTGFTGSDVDFAGSTVGGMLAAAVSGSGANYQVSVTGMSGSGTVVASIPKGAATDSNGNGTSESSSDDNEVTFVPEAAPSVTINQAAGQADPTSSSPILYEVLFSEPVTGFTGSDVSFAGSTVGGTLAASVSGSGASYQVSVTGMTSSGNVVASIPAGAATDSGGSQSSASTSNDNTVAYVQQSPPTGPSCNGVAATIYVGADGRIVGGPDNGKLYRGKLNGTPGADVMVGTAGHDEFAGRAGNDRICGGDGNDELEGGGGNDALFGEGGNDELAAGGGNDSLTGGLGADKFLGGAGRDTATDFTPAQGDTKSGVEVWA